MDIRYTVKINDRDIKLLSMLGKGIKHIEMTKTCGIVQPRISKRIDLLEHELGPLLNIDREGKRSYRSSLTDNGARVVAIAEQIDELFVELRKYRLKGVPSSPVTEDVTGSIASDLRALAARLDSYNNTAN